MLSRRGFVRGAALLCAGLAASFASGCKGHANFPQISKIMYLSPYDWDGLLRAGDRLAYYEDDILCSRWGIDVSEHQHEISWAPVAEFGVQFAFIRIGNRGATAGALKTDDCFLTNAVASSGAGIETLGYFFSQAVNEAEAIEEAEYAMRCVQEANILGANITTIAFDHEPVLVEGARANDLTNEQLTANTVAFCEMVESAGFSAMIYGNQRDLAKVEWGVRQKYPVWLAEYDVETPTAEMNFDIWQYSNAGTIPGISTSVDLNIWFEI